MKLFFIGLGAIWISLFGAAILNYPGSPLVYAVFSVVFLILLISGFRERLSYGYLYLVVFLWLGFWLKITLHAIFLYPFVEPVGTFGGSPSEWDGLLTIALAAALSAIGMKLLLKRIAPQLSLTGTFKEITVPGWYVQYRKVIWGIFLIVIIGVAFLNVYWQIFQIGIVPQTILPWPGNAIIALSLSIGLVMGVATIVWWELSSGKSVASCLGLMVAEAFLSSTSIMSRGLYLFHLAPQIISLHFLKKININYLKQMAWVGLMLLVMVYSILLTTASRNELYAQSPDDLAKYDVEYTAMRNMEYELLRLRQQFTKTVEMSQRIAVLEKAIVEKDIYQAKDIEGSAVSTLHTMLGLMADRWLGLEGLMAVYAHPHKSFGVFRDNFSEKGEVGETDLYQDISKSMYRYSDVSKFQFGTLPGIVGFLYLSGSIFFVCIGIMFVVVVLFVFEIFVLKLTRNPVLSSVLSFSLANVIAQFGGSPRNMVPYFSVVIVGVMLLWFIQWTKPDKSS